VDVPALHSFAESPEQVGVDPERLEELFERAQREIREGLLPSVQIAVARCGKIAGMRTFGTVTHAGQPSKASNDTLYTVFSATKAITSSAVWLLIQDGKLSIEERVADIVPGFGDHGKERITVEQVLTHTSGFPHARLGPPDWYDREGRLKRFREWRLSFEPGTRFEYHPTSGMWVMAEIITRRAGIEFRKFVRERIAEPLGLRNLFVGLPPEENGRVADLVHMGKEISDEELAARGLPKLPETEVTEENLQNFNLARVRELGVPGGGGIMTASDLALFYQALLRDGGAHGGRPIWTQDVLRMASEIRTGDLFDPVFRKRANRGLGIIIAGGRDRNYRGFGHTGSDLMFGHNGAGGQIAWADPETGISFAYCTNGFDRNWLRLGRRTVGLSSRAALCAMAT
jgi:CubicO group peptidase (beta-lactamase class C family)